jgi:hypothetical protein
MRDALWMEIDNESLHALSRKLRPHLDMKRPKRNGLVESPD